MGGRNPVTWAIIAAFQDVHEQVTGVRNKLGMEPRPRMWDAGILTILTTRLNAQPRAELSQVPLKASIFLTKFLVVCFCQRAK